MTLDQDACYRILEARDARYDGIFFVGVSSTGIYCRCVCPAKVPKRENCTFYDSAAKAEEAGYRPCLRCRPENAPGKASVDALKSRAKHAARLIEHGALDEQSLDEFAESLGVSGRQLRRSMQEELGVSPVQFAQTCRLLNAKRLLTDTQMPVGEVALASGFNSLRRFNDLFSTRYKLSPSALRKKRGSAKDNSVTCDLAYRPPYHWDRHLAFLKSRRIAGVERIDGESYARSVALNGKSGWIRVTRSAKPNTLRVEVSESLCPVLPKVLERVRRVFDLDADPLSIAQALGEFGEDHPGLRLPGAFDGFEAAVRAVLGQQISVAFATTLAGRIAEAFGDPVQTDDPEIKYTFPDAARLAGCVQDDIAKLGIIGARARAIIAVADAVANKKLLLSPAADYEETREALLALPGIGPWTAEYISMRALCYPDAFPAQDVGVFKALGTRDPKRATEQVEKFRPWRSYAVIHLWNRLSNQEK